MVSVEWWRDAGDSGSLMATCFFARPSNASMGVKWPRLNKLFSVGSSVLQIDYDTVLVPAPKATIQIAASQMFFFLSPSDCHGCHKQHKPGKEGRFIEHPEAMNTIYEHSIAHSFLCSIRACTEIVAPDTGGLLILALQGTGARILLVPWTGGYLAKPLCVLVAVAIPVR